MDLTEAGLRERARETVTLWFRKQWPASTLDPHIDGDYKTLTREIETTLLALRDAARAEQREQDAKIAAAAYMPGTNPDGEWQRACRNAAAAIRQGGEK